VSDKDDQELERDRVAGEKRQESEGKVWRKGVAAN